MNEIHTESLAEVLLGQGATERQIAGVKNIMDVLEKELTALHLQIVGLRALAHCSKDESLGRLADTVIWQSNGLLDALKTQVDSVSGLLGVRRERQH